MTTRSRSLRPIGSLTNWFKHAMMNAVSVGILAAGASVATAQPFQASVPQAATATGVPTTRILAIGTLTAKANAETLKPVLPTEVRQTVQLYLDGKLDQWFVKQDQTGVVFVLNVTSTAEAHALLENLPLGQAGLMEFQLIALGPLKPLGVLLKTDH